MTNNSQSTGRGFSVFAKCALLVTASTAIVAAVLTIYSFRSAASLARDSVSRLGETVVSSVAEQMGGAIRFGKLDLVGTELQDAIDASGGQASFGIAVGIDGEVLAEVGDVSPGDRARALDAARSALDGADDAGRFVIGRPVTVGAEANAVGAISMIWSPDTAISAIARDKQRAVLVAGIAFLVILGAGTLLLRQIISVPLRAVGRTMSAVADGDYSVDVPGLKRRDEIGAIARDLAAFRDSLSLADAAARDAAFQSAGVRNASAAIMLVDAEGTVVFVNPAFRKLWTPALAEQSGVKTAENAGIGQFHPDLGQIARGLTEAREVPNSHQLRLAGRELDLDVGVISDAGRPIGAVIEWRDVTESARSKAILDALDASQLRLEFGLGRDITGANRNFCDMIGEGPDAILGKAFDTYIRSAGDDDGLVDRLWADGSHGRRSVFGRFEIATPAGPAVLDGTICAVLDAQDKPRHYVMLAKDITATANNLAEAERRRSEMEAAQGKVVDTLQLGLERLAAGDLTFRIEDPLDPAHEALRLDFNAAVTALSTAVSDVAELATAMRSEIDEIVSASQSLSRRTEQQASTLEETAASMEEITKAVKQSAESASLAGRIVGEARDGASQTRTVVHDGVSAMGRIAESSGQISKIISVINDIAFQTNLLALNAGVEAARAGDAGRGFAVVASEVRALAQRSSDAAAEIAELIQSSAKNVEQGESLVGEAGQALEDIAAHVNRISDHVQGIVGAAQDQSSALTEINAAVGDIDRATQQNAAMFEETSAASTALAKQSDALLASVTRFRVPDAATGRNDSVAPRPAPPAQSPRHAATAAAARSAEPAADGWEEF